MNQSVTPSYPLSLGSKISFNSRETIFSLETQITRKKIYINMQQKKIWTLLLKGTFVYCASIVIEGTLFPKWETCIFVNLYFHFEMHHLPSLPCVPSGHESPDLPAIRGLNNQDGGTPKNFGVSCLRGHFVFALCKDEVHQPWCHEGRDSR